MKTLLFCCCMLVLPTVKAEQACADPYFYSKSRDTTILLGDAYRLFHAPFKVLPSCVTNNTKFAGAHFFILDKAGEQVYNLEFYGALLAGQIKQVDKFLRPGHTIVFDVIKFTSATGETRQVPQVSLKIK